MHLIVLSTLFLLCSTAPPKHDNRNLELLIEKIFRYDDTKSLNVSKIRPPSKVKRDVYQSGLEGLIDEVYGTTASQGHYQDCVCTYAHQCPSHGSVNTDGSGLIDIRSKSYDRRCTDINMVCCKVTSTTPSAPVNRGCGRRNVGGTGFRITEDGYNSHETDFGEFPWMVGISHYTTHRYLCGGALIHPRAVLTGAHCVRGLDPKKVSVRAGEWNVASQDEILSHQNRRVHKIISHADFKSDSLHNDFAILILSSPVDLQDHIQTICLPEGYENFDYSRCVVTGWGAQHFNPPEGKEPNYSAVLKSTELPIVPNDICQDVLRRTRLGPHFKLDQSFVCAGGEPGVDSCKGDGGGPLVCPLKRDPRRYVQVGIVSWGISCGENQIPGVYASVARARSWIDQVMAKNRLDSDGYIST